MRRELTHHIITAIATFPLFLVIAIMLLTYPQTFNPWAKSQSFFLLAIAFPSLLVAVICFPNALVGLRNRQISMKRELAQHIIAAIATFPLLLVTVNRLLSHPQAFNPLSTNQPFELRILLFSSLLAVVICFPNAVVGITRALRQIGG